MEKELIEVLDNILIRERLILVGMTINTIGIIGILIFMVIKGA